MDRLGNLNVQKGCTTPLVDRLPLTLLGQVCSCMNNLCVDMFCRLLLFGKQPLLPDHLELVEALLLEFLTLLLGQLHTQHKRLHVA